MNRRDTILIAGVTIGILVLTAGGIGVLIWQHAKAGGFRIDETYAPLYLAEARDRMARKDYQGAVKSFTLAAEANPDIVDPLLGRASAHEILGEPRKAADDYHAALDVDSENATALIALARLFYYTSESAALDYLNRAVIADDGDLVARSMRAELHHRLGNIEGAIDDLDALVTRANNPEYLQRRAELKMLIAADEAALKDVESIRTNARYGPSTDRLAGWARWGLGDYEGALTEFDRAVGHGENETESNFGRGAALLALGRFGEAVDELRIAVNDPYRERAYPWLFLWAAEARHADVVTANATLRAAINEGRFAGAWPRRLAQFLLGDLAESELLDVASQPGDLTTDQRMCEALYYAGARRAAIGDEEGAVNLFKACVATRIRDYYEYQAALAELRRRGLAE